MNKLLSAGTLLFALTGANAFAAPLELTFDNPVEADNIPLTGTPYAALGVNAYSGTVRHFENVAIDGSVSVDAIVTITQLAPGNGDPDGGQYGGQIADWNQLNGATEPNADLAPLYSVQGSALNNNPYSGMFEVKIDFFDGTNGLFDTPYNISELSILAYDIDGESISGAIIQRESLSVKKDDGSGFVSFQVSNDASALTAVELANDWLFLGTGNDVPETSQLGSVQLNYINTTGITLTLGSRNAGQNDLNDGVFTGISGDAFINIDGDTVIVGPGNPAPVPEPHPLTLLSSMLLAIGLIRRRK